jgi:uncharacterized protein YgiM (DUF1202 family)
MTGIVITDSGRLNVREKPTTSSHVLTRIPKDETVALGDAPDGWYAVTYNGYSGYVSSEFISVSYKAAESTYRMTFTVANEAMLEELTGYLKEFGITPEVTEVGD